MNFRRNFPSRKPSPQSSVQIEGKTLKVGDVVGFKYDTEQYAPITKIVKHAFGGTYITVQAEAYDEEGYVEEEFELELLASDCWVD